MGFWGVVFCLLIAKNGRMWILSVTIQGGIIIFVRFLKIYSFQVLTHNGSHIYFNCNIKYLGHWGSLMGRVFWSGKIHT